MFFAIVIPYILFDDHFAMSKLQILYANSITNGQSLAGVVALEPLLLFCSANRRPNDDVSPM